MKKGYALLLGLNHVDSNHYAGWDGELLQPENDATEMNLVATEKGLQTQLLTGEKVTRKAVISEIRNAASQLNGGDLFFLYYSGHGGQVPDYDGDEEDGMDETWCLYDGQLIDDELYALWGEFKEGVRILVISDSCHSGTMVKAIPDFSSPADQLDMKQWAKKAMPNKIVLKTYIENKEFYDDLAKDLLKARPEEKQDGISVLLISGCMDHQSSYAFMSDPNSAFTTAMKGVLKCSDQINYSDLHKKITEELDKRLKGRQTPNLDISVGTGHDEFLRQDFLAI